MKSVKGWAYAKGMTGEVEDEKAERLISAGCATPVIGNTDGSDLPDDFPARALLIREGLNTKKKVAAAMYVLNEIKGIGMKTAEDIITRIKQDYDD